MTFVNCYNYCDISTFCDFDNDRSQDSRFLFGVSFIRSILDTDNTENYKNKLTFVNK